MMIISHIYWLALPLLFRHVFSTWHVDYMLGWFPFLFISFHFTSLCFVCCVLLLLLCVRKDFMVVYNIIIGEWHTCFIRIYPNACGYFRIEKKICSVLVVENMTYPRGKSYLCTREKLLNAKQWQKQQQLLVAREPKPWREGAWNSKSGGKNMVIENISRSHIPVVCMHRQIYKCMYIVYKIYLYSIKVVPKWTQSFRCPPFICRRRCARCEHTKSFSMYSTAQVHYRKSCQNDWKIRIPNKRDATLRIRAILELCKQNIVSKQYVGGGFSYFYLWYPKRE